MNHKFHNKSDNFHRFILDKTFISTLLSELKKRLGRNLYQTEKNYLIDFLKSISPHIFEGKNRSTIITSISDYISEEIAQHKCGDPNKEIDIHEMLKSNIGVSSEADFAPISYEKEQEFTDEIITSFSNTVDIGSFLGNTSITDLQRIVNPELVKNHAYLTFDTRYRVLANDGTTQFTWNFVNSDSLSQGSFNSITDIGDIMAIRIYPIRIPYTSNLDNNSYDRVTMLIEEFRAQSFIGQENRRYHFVFNTDIDSSNPNNRWIDLCPENHNDGYFRFAKPITQLDTITITFGSPLQELVFDTDRLNAGVNSYGNTTEWIFGDDHNLETGDRVYIQSFTTNNTNRDINAISAMNNENGLIITKTGADSFTVDVDTSNIRAGPGTGTVTITNNSAIITGSGTTFSSLLIVGDRIEINGIQYIIQSIESDTSLTISSPYTGTTTSGLQYFRNNRVNGLNIPHYFGSKRIFINMEVEFYASNNS